MAWWFGFCRISDSILHALQKLLKAIFFLLSSCCPSPPKWVKCKQSVFFMVYYLILEKHLFCKNKTKRKHFLFQVFSDISILPHRCHHLILLLTNLGTRGQCGGQDNQSKALVGSSIDGHIVREAAAVGSGWTDGTLWGLVLELWWGPSLSKILVNLK